MRLTLEGRLEYCSLNLPVTVHDNSLIGLISRGLSTLEQPPLSEWAIRASLTRGDGSATRDEGRQAYLEFVV